MNDTKRVATLAWLLQHAELGELPDHLDDECRTYAMTFVGSAMAVARKHREPAVLAEITQGKLEGEYHG